MEVTSEESHGAPQCQVEARGSSTQGKGLFSRAQFKRGDVVFTERPTIASQVHRAVTPHVAISVLPMVH